MKGGFKHSYLLGLPHSLIVSILKGKEPWNLRNNKKDSEET
jgi:hypothetical protein